MRWLLRCSVALLCGIGCGDNSAHIKGPTGNGDSDEGSTSSPEGGASVVDASHNQLDDPPDASDVERDGGALDPDAASQPGDPGPAVCGDDLVAPDEECDGNQAPCSELGFDLGVLACDEDCAWVSDDCSGTETCYDGKDNDGDRAVDCEDVEDCEVACASSCANPVIASDPLLVTGRTQDHADELSSSCSSDVKSGTEVVYQFTAEHSGKLDVRLETSKFLRVSVRTTCADAESELLCGSTTRLTHDVTAGDTVFVVVEGYNAAAEGNYTLNVSSRAVACGDGIRDDTEACDDENLASAADGCDENCELVSSETEPANDDLITADSYQEGVVHFAEIAPANDVDVIAITLSAASSSLLVSTQNLGDGACGLGLMDPLLELLDTDEQDNAILAEDDDGGDGLCAKLIVRGLPPGTYYARVRAAPSAEPSTFPYRLGVSIGDCGDGELASAEDCDDGNRAAGDGCSADCSQEN